jgi:hypothetical protein
VLPGPIVLTAQCDGMNSGALKLRPVPSQFLGSPMSKQGFVARSGAKMPLSMSLEVVRWRVSGRRGWVWSCRDKEGSY